MAIVDEKNFLTPEEHKMYKQLIKRNHYKPNHLLVEVTEDQAPMDMNDMDYIIILNIKITNVETGKSNTYFSKLGSETWLSEFEQDLQREYFKAEK